MGEVDMRYSALCKAFEELTKAKPDLRISDEGPPFQIILQKMPEGPAVSLTVGPHSARVIGTSGSDSGGTSEVEDHLSVDLSHDYRWDSVVFEDAGDLAYHLYKHMLRRTDSVSHLDPKDEG